MRILGLDVGERRIGVAVSDPLGITAQPLAVLERRGARVDLEAVAALVKRHAAERVVVGLPLMLSGAVGVQAQKVRAFSEALGRRLQVPIELVDERLTTVQGARSLIEARVPRRRKKAVIDQVAAQLILQQFLDARRPPGRADDVT